MTSLEQVSPPQMEMPKRPPGSRRTVLWAVALAAIVLLGIGISPRIERRARAAGIADAAAVSPPTVVLVKATLSPGSSEVELPGSIQAINVASIYARANGYVRERFVDIGTPVRAGQLLAVIASPEVDQELAQGRAALEQAQAALQQANANLTQAQAQVNQTRANVRRAQANEEIAATTSERWTHLVACRSEFVSTPLRSRPAPAVSVRARVVTPVWNPCPHGHG